MKEMNRENKGFTLAELLIVVAIIAVLVAISIPIFTAQLEKSRESVDAANLRSAYAECTADLLTNEDATVTTVYKKVDPKQMTSGWDLTVEQIGSTATIPDLVKGTPAYVVVNADGTSSITTAKPSSGKELN